MMKLSDMNTAVIAGQRLINFERVFEITDGDHSNILDWEVFVNVATERVPVKLAALVPAIYAEYHRQCDALENMGVTEWRRVKWKLAESLAKAHS